MSQVEEEAADFQVEDNKVGNEKLPVNDTDVQSPKKSRISYGGTIATVNDPIETDVSNIDSAKLLGEISIDSITELSKVDKKVKMVKNAVDSDDEDDFDAASYNSLTSLVAVDESLRDNIFTKLSVLPRFSEISLDSTIDMSIEPAASTEELEVTKSETLANQTIAEQLEVVEAKQESLEKEDQQQEQESSSATDMEEDDELLVLLETNKLYDVELDEVYADEAMQTFMEMEEAKVVPTEPEIDVELLMREELERNIRKEVSNFLEALIKTVVLQREFIDPKHVIGESLNKTQLMNELIDKIHKLNVEQAMNDALNSAIVRFFKRKHKLREITNEPEEEILRNKAKLGTAMKRLDVLLEKEKALNEEINMQMDEYREELEAIERESSNMETQLNELIKKVIMRNNAEQLNAFVAMSLVKMHRFRDEISQVRFHIISKQDSLARIKKKLSKMENLCENVTLRDFEQYQSQTSQISKKLEARSIDLEQVRQRFNSELHMMAHYREEIEVLKDIIHKKKSGLIFLCSKRKHLRMKIHQDKMKRCRVRHQLEDLTGKGGLIGKPELMLEYDKTEDTLLAKSTEVKELRAKFEQMSTRLAELQKKYNAKRMKTQ